MKLRREIFMGFNKIKVIAFQLLLLTLFSPASYALDGDKGEKVKIGGGWQNVIYDLLNGTVERDPIPERHNDTVEGMKETKQVIAELISKLAKNTYSNSSGTQVLNVNPILLTEEGRLIAPKLDGHTIGNYFAQMGDDPNISYDEIFGEKKALEDSLIEPKKELTRAIYKEASKFGNFEIYADLHNGNIMIEPQTGKLTVVDPIVITRKVPVSAVPFSEPPLPEVVSSVPNGPTSKTPGVGRGGMMNTAVGVAALVSLPAAFREAPEETSLTLVGFTALGEFAPQAVMPLVGLMALQTQAQHTGRLLELVFEDTDPEQKRKNINQWLWESEQGVNPSHYGGGFMGYSHASLHSFGRFDLWFYNVYWGLPQDVSNIWLGAHKRPVFHPVPLVKPIPQLGIVE